MVKINSMRRFSYFTCEEFSYREILGKSNQNQMELLPFDILSMKSGYYVQFICYICSDNWKTTDMAANNTTPLWLNLKKEYIDDNFEEFLEYMRGHGGSKGKDDVFFETSLELLEERVKALISDMVETPLFEDNPKNGDSKRDIRLLACYLLVCPKGPQALAAYVALMMQLAMVADARFADALLHCAAQRIKVDKVVSLGFTWEQVINFQRDTFVYFAFQNVKFGEEMAHMCIYQNKGCVTRSAKGLLLIAVAKDKAAKMMDDGTISLESDMNVGLLTASGDRLKQQRERDVEAIHAFSNTFVNMLKKVKPVTAARMIHYYADGDRLVVRVVSKQRETITVESVDPAYEKVKGQVVFKKNSLLYYRPSKQIIPYIKEGDLLHARMTDCEKNIFSIEEEFVKFMVEYAEEHRQSDIHAMIIDFQPDKNHTIWLSDNGVIMYSEYADGDRRDDTARLEIVEYGSGPYLGKIDADVIVEDTKEIFSQLNAREAFVRAFAMDAKMPVKKVEAEVEMLSETFLKLVLRLLFARQKQILNPVERYVMLCQARSLAVALDDDLSASYIRFTSKYLRALIQFVREGDIGGISLDPDPAFAKSKSAMIRMGVLQLLNEYDSTQDSPVLQRTITDFADSIPMLSNLARLIQLSNGMKELVSGASMSVIKREIVKTLSINTEEDADLEAANGNYLGVESDTIEFKQSFVYPPDSNMQPAPDKQAFNVLRGVCAFLNSTLGGTLYLGVNDSGYVTGIENDMNYLHINTIDSYMRYVQDKAKQEIGLDAIAYLHMEPLYDNQVVAIHVEPHPFRLVELREKSYLRINAESREMPENVRQQIITQKVYNNRNESAALSMLQHAYSTKRTVILHNYASNNSGTISDRTIEPFQVITESGMVYGYNVNDKCNKMYAISRIGYVEILGQKWEHSDKHIPVQVDDFHMTGTKPIHVSLQLNLAARNLLVEEYPSAKTHITADKNDENIWYYDADVYRIEGIGRFYIGLANHIQILKGDELKNYAMGYAKNYLMNNSI